MQVFLKVFCFIGILALCTCSCNKKCTCTTSGVPQYEGEIVYDHPNSKKACQNYQKRQNESLNAIGGTVTCVYK